MGRIFVMAKIGIFVLLYCAMGYGATPQSASTVYCALTDDPTPFVGKHIVVRAVYRYGFEIQRLDPADCCPGKKLEIWVEIGPLDAQSRRLLKRFPKGMGLTLATFSGVFETGGPFGDGGYRYRLTVDHIENVEATTHPSEANRPPWTNRDCVSGSPETPATQSSSILHESDHADPPKPQ
jgi:hypothetical protein